MMINVFRRSPIDYRLCNQTVTIYHWDGANSYTKKVIQEGAFLEFKKVGNIEKTGSKEATSFLLVIPGSTVQVAIGDKVLPGVGADVTTREAWASLIPSKVQNLAVVKYVDPKYWRGCVVHTEAGG